MAEAGAHMIIDGEWVGVAHRETRLVTNPATGEVTLELAIADNRDIDRALAGAERAFTAWRRVSCFDRANIIHTAASLIRQRGERIAAAITSEAGKTIGEARGEVATVADVFDWSAGQARRISGETVAPRVPGVRQFVVHEPIGPVAAFSPWNSPALLAGRKMVEALAAGCTFIIKPAEETPSASIEIARALVDAGAPAGTVNVLFGEPSAISTRLIQSPIVRKVTFTGSVPVGRQLAAMAGQHLKRCTMELGGHAPVFVFDDADVETTVRMLMHAKTRNAGQACISPTRVFAQGGVYRRFRDLLIEAANAVAVGDGFDPSVQMGPVANSRRLNAMGAFCDDAKSRGAKIEAGGVRVGTRGYFWRPTVITDAPLDSMVMTQEPFGPIASLSSFNDVKGAIEEANRLPVGLAAYAFTQSNRHALELSDALETGLVGINTFGVYLPEAPFGGVKDTGFGREGGAEGLSAYLTTKFVAHAS